MKIRKRVLGFTAVMISAILAATVSIPTQKVSASETDASGITFETKPLGSYLSSESKDEILDFEANLPAQFDLRDEQAVTRVKLQNPWGTCWAFGAAAASEISILTELGMTPAEFQEKYGHELNLSEKHLSWFTFHTVDAGPQTGEGFLSFDDSPEGQKKTAYSGGVSAYAESIFSQLCGAVDECESPDRDGSTPFAYCDNNGGRDENADWSLKDSYRYYYSFELENGNILPGPATWGEKGEYIYDPAATDLIKKELMKGHGVEISYYADWSTPEQAEGGIRMQYTNMTNGQCAQYVYEEQPSNHGVCIVGWDDTFSKKNFNPGHQPPADGAWIVKNSWGSGTDAKEGDPDYMNSYGFEDEQGRKTGYFHLSYYDQSISGVDSFDFITERIGSTGTVVGQYDYMPENHNIGHLYYLSDKSIKAANIFEAGTSMDLFAVSVATPFADSRVNFEVYRLNENPKNPEDGVKVDSKTAAFDYAGFHRINLNGRYHFAPGEKYSVIVTQKANTDEGYRYILSANRGLSKELAEKYNKKYYAAAVVNPGESWYKFTEEKEGWKDWSASDSPRTEYIIDNAHEFGEVDNFPIKAYGEPTNGTELSMSVKAGKKSFTAQWDKVQDAEGYDIKWWTKDDRSDLKTKTVKADVTKKKISKLKSKKEYNVEVSAWYTNSSGEKSYMLVSPEHTVRTK